MMFPVWRYFAACTLLLVSACSGGDDGPVTVAFIGDRSSAFTNSWRLSDPAQHIRAAQSQGLVTLDPAGQVAPGLADRWIVTDEGRSYVFRLREGEWPDGRELNAETVRAVMVERLRELRGTSLALDLAPVDDVRTMAERVVEFRLSSPVPDLLQLLAQPELALTPWGEKSIPMVLFELEERTSLDMSAPERRGLPVDPEWQDYVRRIDVTVGGAQNAVERFNDGEVDLVLGGRVGDLPLAEVGALTRGTVRLDPALGLLGLQFRRSTGALGDPVVREGLALALDREALITPFGIGGWTPSASVIPILAEGDVDRWADIAFEDRQALAARRVGPLQGGEPLKLFLGTGPGADTLLAGLRDQWAAVGVMVQRVDVLAESDLYLVDRVARFAGPRWFLNQFNCGLDRGLCSDAADDLVAQSIVATNNAERLALLAEARRELDDANVYISLGAPIRWSLVRGDVSAFTANSWAFHPLPPLAEIPR